ncbi:MAG: glycosyltransferase family 4 protein [Candidatus Sedimenticola sp. (ex Thyasira tokunagai)]
MAEKRLTVLQVLPALEGGGVEKGTLEVAAELVRLGHRSLVMSAGGRLVKTLESQGSRHYSWGIGSKSLWTLRHIWPLRRFLLEQQVDILHVRSRAPAWVVWLAWRGMNPNQRPRLVTTLHGLHSVSAYSAVMTRGERVIAVSDTVRRYIEENYPQTDLSSVKVVYRGVDSKEFPRGFEPSHEWLAEWQGQFPQLQGRFVVALPGRMTRLKGHHDFLEVVDILKCQGLAVTGLIVGGEDPRRLAYAKEIHRAVAQRGLGEEIVFTGHRADVREIFSRCDAVMSLSTKPESFGRTTLEALSLGVPVVGYDHGGVGEVMETLYPFGKVGLGNMAAAAEKLMVIARGEAPEPAENSRYLKSRMLEDTLALYLRLAGER